MSDVRKADLEHELGNEKMRSRLLKAKLDESIKESVRLQELAQFQVKDDIGLVHRCALSDHRCKAPGKPSAECPELEKAVEIVDQGGALKWALENPGDSAVIMLPAGRVTVRYDRRNAIPGTRFWVAERSSEVK